MLGDTEFGSQELGVDENINESSNIPNNPLPGYQGLSLFGQPLWKTVAAQTRLSNIKLVECGCRISNIDQLLLPTHSTHYINCNFSIMRKNVN